MNNKNELIFSAKTMRLLRVLLITAFLLPCILLHSQESTTKLSVYPTFGIGTGLFYPRDVNKYIENETSNMIVTSGIGGFTLLSYYEIKGGITFRLKNVDFNGMLEYDIAPKYVLVTNGDNVSYMYSKFSPEISTNFYIPGKSGKHAFFIGGGLNYIFLKFKQYSAASPGFKLQLGYSMQFGNFNVQPNIAFKYIKANDFNFNLDYSGVLISVIFSFHKRINYK